MVMPAPTGGPRSGAFRPTAAGIAAATGGSITRKGGTGVVRRFIADSRDARPGDCFIALPGERVDGHAFVANALARGAAGAVVMHPLAAASLPRNGFVVQVGDTRAALGRLAAEWRRLHSRVRVVGITGSCGKTSTKNMLGRVLSQALPTVFSPKSFNNSIGVPLTLFQISADTRAAVVEIGTNAPGEIEALARITQPDLAIVTCIGESHLDGLGSLEGVAREKAMLLRSLAPGGVAILNGDDPSTAPHLVPAVAGRVVRTRLGQTADWFATDIKSHGLGTSFLLQGERAVTIPLLGSHNVSNALMTIAAATELGVNLDFVLASLADMPVTARRLQCREVYGVQVFDDTYNMNPASARAALMAMAGLPASGRRIVVFGEMKELGPRSDDLHTELGAEVAARDIDILVTVGSRAACIAAGAEQAGLAAGRILRTHDQGEAIERLLAVLQPHDRLLCKASHSVGFDRLVDALTAALQQRGQQKATTDERVAVAHT